MEVTAEALVAEVPRQSMAMAALAVTAEMPVVGARAGTQAAEGAMEG